MIYTFLKGNKIYTLNYMTLEGPINTPLLLDHLL